MGFRGNGAFARPEGVQDAGTGKSSGHEVRPCRGGCPGCWEFGVHRGPLLPLRPTKGLPRPWGYF